MKTLILYATKYGTAAEIAQRIAGRIDGAVVHDLKRGGVYDPQKANGLDKMLLKAAKKPTGYTNTLSDDKIAEFTEAVKA